MPQTGLMMNRPLLISGILEHGAAQFGDQEIVSRETHGPLHRYTYADAAKRARQLAHALAQMGLKAGSAVGSIAWNNHRHLEAYYAVSGSGMVMHTCNPRLHPQQLIYVINHAEDEVVLFDATFAPLVKGIAAHCPQVRAWVCLADAANTPTIEGVAHVMNYEGLITGQPDTFDWPEFNENTGAALCYTSGTTGNPKGVLYTHRAIVMNATTAGLPDVLGLSTQETILPVVPMFHINAWCIPYAALVAGTKLVLPGPKLDGPSLFELMDSEQVTISAGVPTIWMGLIQHVEQNNLRFAHMKRTAVGGSAMPMALIAKFMDTYGV
ncbi:MAG: AMP-binding protein, partial [Limnohabitans sp.]|nr:AMP-binding protein [Limnohabitans sp.]